MERRSTWFAFQQMKNHTYNVDNIYVKIDSVADPKGEPPMDLNFLNFIQFLGKTWQICMLAPPPGRLAPPPRRILDPPL